MIFAALDYLPVSFYSFIYHFVSIFTIKRPPIHTITKKHHKILGYSCRSMFDTLMCHQSAIKENLTILTTPIHHTSFRNIINEMTPSELAYVIESATGKDLTKYAEEKIWRKIGLEHDLFWSLDKEDGDEKAFCCIYATARDYAKLGLLLLNKGVYNNEQIIPEWYYNEMVSPQNLTTLDGTSNYRYGLHIWTYLDPKGKVNYCRGMRGQYIITIPKENIVIVRLGAKSKKRIRVSNNDFDEISLKLGHSPDLFDYINLAKLIASEY